MPNINRPRTSRNTNYVTQIDKIESRGLRELVVDDGTIVECEQIYYVSINGDWYPFAPLNNQTLEIGWARYDDNEFSVSSPFNFSEGISFEVPNNAGKVIDLYNLNAYNGTEFTLEEGCTYSLTIAFKAHLNTNNGHMTINLNCETDTDYSRIGDVIIFPKGNGVEHTFSRVFNFYVNTNVAIKGLKIIMEGSHSGSLYEVIYFIEKLSHA